MVLGMHGSRTMIFGKRFYIYIYIYIYIIFILSLCLLFIALCICYLILFTSRHIILPLFLICFVSIFGVIQTSEMEHLLVIVYSLYPLTVLTESFIFVVCTGSVCISCYFVSREAIDLLMQ